MWRISLGSGVSVLLLLLLLLLSCILGVAWYIFQDYRYLEHHVPPPSSTVTRIGTSTIHNESSSSSAAVSLSPTTTTSPSLSAVSTTSTTTLKKKNVTTECLMESRPVNGKEFRDVWPRHASPDETIWSLPPPTEEVNHSMATALWQHPSKFSHLCATKGDLGPSFYAPPRYHAQNRPTGLRLIMVGDSLMRYQFIMLIHYLHTGHWIHDSMQPNLLRETSLAGRDGSWPAFYQALERYFGQDRLICDGYRSRERIKWPETMYENSFYLDQECLDNSVVFAAKFSFGLRGYETPGDINQWFHSKANNKTKMALPEGPHDKVNFTWSYENDYDQFLRNFVARLEPRPRVFIFNEGLWPGTSENLSNETLLRQIQATIHELGMVSIYKTTTKEKPDTTPGLVEYEELCCQIFDYCLRMDWTACVPQNEYWDRYHFFAYTNLRSVEQLFEILEQIGIIPW